MTFIYVVYILTFVSAVVMLFLSVVLMLPSSAISISTKSSSPLLTMTVGAPHYLNEVMTVFTLLAVPVICYIIFAAYKTVAYRRSEEEQGTPKQSVAFTYAPGAQVPQEVKNLETRYTLKTFTSSKVNSVAAASALSYTIDGANASSQTFTTGDHLARIYHDTDLTKYISGVNSMNFPVYIKVYPKHFFKLPGKFMDYRLFRVATKVAQEFVEFYFRVLEPVYFSSSKVYTSATKGLKTSLGLLGNNRDLPSF